MSVPARTVPSLTAGHAQLSGYFVALAITVVCLAGAACGFQSSTATPTAVPDPTPAPRPTAEPPAVVSAWYLGAQSEESVRIRADLTTSEIDALKKMLARRYPQVSVDWRRGTDADLLQQTLDEARSPSPNWDIYIGDNGPTLKTARLALRWTPPEALEIPPTLVDSEGAWYALATTYHVLQYNSDQVPPAYVPPTYDALRHPGYFGRMAIEDLSLTWLKGLIEARGRESTTALIQALARQAVVFRRDARSLVVFVTAGDQAVAIDARMDVVERERRAGGKTAWAAPDPVIAQPLVMVVSGGTNRPNGARLVANFLLSPDAQVILAEAGRVPSRTDVDADPQTLARGLNPHVTLPPEGSVERELRALWQELWGRR